MTIGRDTALDGKVPSFPWIRAGHLFALAILLFCTRAGAFAEENAIPSLSVQELKAKLDRGEHLALIDVREPFEHSIAQLSGARLIPLGELEARQSEIPRDRDVVLFCHSGIRSARATMLLREHGATSVYNLEGGIDAWSTEIDSDVPRY